MANVTYPLGMIKEVGDVRVLFDLLSGRFYLEGRMADVSDAAHCAVDTYTDDPVLIAFGRRPIVTGHAVLDGRFKTQVERASRLRHPAIASLIELGEDLGTAYFVYARPKGKGLARLLTKQRRPRVPDALTILTDVAAALDYAHSHGVIHGALSSASVIVTPDYKARVLGFGSEAGDAAGRQLTVRGDLDAFSLLARELLASSEAHLNVLQAHGAPATARGLVAALRAVGGGADSPATPGLSMLRRFAIATGLVATLAAGIALSQIGGQAISALSIAGSAAQSFNLR